MLPQPFSQFDPLCETGPTNPFSAPSDQARRRCWSKPRWLSAATGSIVNSYTLYLEGSFCCFAPCLDRSTIVWGNLGNFVLEPHLDHKPTQAFPPSRRGEQLNAAHGVFKTLLVSAPGPGFPQDLAGQMAFCPAVRDQLSRPLFPPCSPTWFGRRASRRHDPLRVGQHLREHRLQRVSRLQGELRSFEESVKSDGMIDSLI